MVFKCVESFSDTNIFYVKILEKEYFFSNILPILSNNSGYMGENRREHYKLITNLVNEDYDIMLHINEINIMKAIIRKEKINKLRDERVC